MKHESLTVLLVRPGMHPEVKTIPNTLHSLQQQVGGMIETVYPWPSEHVCLVCNDEGKLMGLPLNRVIPEIDDAIAGTFFVSGIYYSSDGGDFCSLSEKQIEEFEKKYHWPELFCRSPLGIHVRRCTPEQYDRAMGIRRTEPNRHEER